MKLWQNCMYGELGFTSSQTKIIHGFPIGEITKEKCYYFDKRKEIFSTVKNNINKIKS